ncbi:MAG: helix-turn-helix domain-containing protein [Acidimicrobiia bacterium]|nr:helix-turn-helix domain-containing protein [Acidimicrobiia bacterium]
MGTPRSFGDYPPVLNTHQVAEMLGLPSIKTVQVLVRKGRVPAHRLPGARRYWFVRDEIVEWLRSDETRVTPDAG